MISVLLATYNGEKYIKDQLLSIYNQSLSPDEVVVVDDLSTDKTLDTVKSLRDIFENKGIDFKVYQNIKNKGYALNFWSGLKTCKGDIVILSDQDDIWFNNKIKEIRDFFINNQNCLSVNFSYNLVDSNGTEIKSNKIMKFKNNGEYKNITLNKFLLSPRFPGMSMAINSSLIRDAENIGDNLIVAHDWVLNLLASRKGKMYFCDKILTKYRQHNENTVGTLLNSNKIKDKRISTINNLIHLNSLVEKIVPINDNEAVFIRELNDVLKKRVKNIENESLLKTFNNFILNYKYITLRDLLGDEYAIFKSLF